MINWSEKKGREKKKTTKEWIKMSFNEKREKENHKIIHTDTLINKTKIYKIEKNTNDKLHLQKKKRWKPENEKEKTNRWMQFLVIKM